ncbi:expressed unknown protein [Seminavis robusta]|uniref:Uncharacterized protein n=1 Tax=Seminavis robusta TaxID=568900 RepID=A0A9N8F3G0_9STRA|nr:expressed unknown protein [Seminavis robusta]|eukprot:Sro2627_g332990.1 n/a (365) ;mRNA; f:10055-11305
MLERLIDYSCHSADVEALVDGIGGGSNSSIGRRLVKRTNSSMSETSEISFDFSEGGLADDFWFNDSDYKGTGGNSSGHNSRSFHHSASSACSSCGYRYGVPDERFSLQQLARSNNSISSQRSKSCSHDDHHAGEKRNTSSTSNTLSISDESDNGQSKNGNSNSRSNSNSEMQLGYGGTLPAKTTVTATEELGYGDMKLDNSKAPNQVSSLEYEDASPSSTNGMPLTTNAHNKVFDPASYYATRRRNSMSTGGCRNSGISGLARVHRGGGRRASMEHTSSTTSPTTEPQQPTRSAVSFKMRRRSTSSKEETQDRGTYSITSFIKMESGLSVNCCVSVMQNVKSQFYQVLFVHLTLRFPILFSYVA